MNLEQFKDFIYNGVNKSIDPLEDNPKFDVVVSAIADMFHKLYQRVYDIKITNTTDIFSDSDFQKFLANNASGDGTILKDIFLEHVSVYLNTDHFKETVARMMNLWQDRFNHGFDESKFTEDHIIPTFKYFTRFAGDLHKTKGAITLLERLFDFYGPVNDDEKSFDGVKEHDREDPYGFRFDMFSSVRIAIEDKIFLKRYQTLYDACGEEDLGNDYEIDQFVKYEEMNTHKFVIVKFKSHGSHLFASKKEREDWHHLGLADDIHKITETWFVIIQGTEAKVFKDSQEFIDEDFSYKNTSEYYTPVKTFSDVKFVPKVINIKDEFNEYFYGNFWYIENDGFDMYLARLRHDRLNDTIERTYFSDENGDRKRLAICEDERFRRVENPSIREIRGIDYIRFDFGERELETGQFFNTNDHVWRMIYSVRYSYRYRTEENITYTDNILSVIRDGNEYITASYGEECFGKIESAAESLYILQERVPDDFIRGVLKNHIHGVKFTDAIFDVCIPKSESYVVRDDLNKIGEWNPNFTDVPTTGEIRIPVKRFNSNSIEGFYVLTSKIEEIIQFTDDSEWTLVGDDFFTPMNDGVGVVEVYRCINLENFDYIYTTSQEEFINAIESLGYITDLEDGKIFKAYSNPLSGRIPVYRVYNQTTKRHFFTTNYEELNQKFEEGYQNAFIAFYVYAEAAEIENLFPKNGDYFEVNDNGVTCWESNILWRKGDYAVWNEYLRRWERFTDLIQSQSESMFFVDHSLLVAFNPHTFDDGLPIVTDSSYEQSGGMYNISLSKIELPISSLNDIYSKDNNPIESFGDDPIIMYAFSHKEYKTLFGNVEYKKNFILFVRTNRYNSETDMVNLDRILKNHPVKRAYIKPYKFEVSDRNIIVYAEEQNFGDMGHMIVFLENTLYVTPQGIRTNNINVFYDANTRLKTREAQRYFQETETVCIGGEYVTRIKEDQEVDTFKKTLRRYNPAPNHTDGLQAILDVGFSNQSIDLQDLEWYRNYFVELKDGRVAKEVASLNMKDALELTINGDNPEGLCQPLSIKNDINYGLYFMTLLDDYLLDYQNVQSAFTLTKMGWFSDHYSNGLEPAVRWSSTDYLYYTAVLNTGSTIEDTIVDRRNIRQRFILNMYEDTQTIFLDGEPELSSKFLPLEYIHELVIVYDVYNELDDEWEEYKITRAYKQIKTFSKCSPNGYYYFNDNVEIPEFENVNPWEELIYLGGEISL